MLTGKVLLAFKRFVWREDRHAEATIDTSGWACVTCHDLK